MNAFKKAADIGKKGKTFKTKASSEKWSGTRRRTKRHMPKREGG